MNNKNLFWRQNTNNVIFIDGKKHEEKRMAATKTVIEETFLVTENSWDI